MKQEFDYNALALEISNLLTEKQQAYGDSFGRSNKILEVLYPEGVKVEDYRNMLTIVRIIDKLFRIATDKDAFGEDPFKDVAGYAILAAARNKKD